MTVVQTIALAQTYRAAGNTAAAMRILTGGYRAALSDKAQKTYVAAIHAILHNNI